jgi:lysine/ornithine N-monooxygenase
MQKNYANYIRWCIDSLKDEVDYCPITKLSLIYDASRREYLYKITTERNDYYARSIVLSTSKVFDIPSIFQPFIGKEVFHISAYSKHIKAFSKDKEHNFAIVGESEFVTEIQWDLYRNFPNSRITSFASACSFNSKNSNYFISENYYTSNIEFFYKNALVAYNNQQKTNCNFLDSSQNFYYSISRQPEDVQRLFVKNNTILDSVTKKNDRYLLSYKNTSEEDVFPGEFDAIIIATAFKNQNFKEAQEYYSGLIEKVRSCFNIDSDGNFAINQNHSLQSAKEFIPPIFINERYQFDIDNFWPNLLIRNSEIIEAINFYLSKNEVSSS